MKAVYTNCSPLKKKKTKHTISLSCKILSWVIFFWQRIVAMSTIFARPRIYKKKKENAWDRGILRQRPCGRIPEEEQYIQKKFTYEFLGTLSKVFDYNILIKALAYTYLLILVTWLLKSGAKQQDYNLLNYNIINTKNSISLEIGTSAKYVCVYVCGREREKPSASIVTHYTY